LTPLPTVDPIRTARSVPTPSGEDNAHTSINIPPDEPVVLKPNLGHTGTYVGAEIGSGVYAPLHFDTLTIEPSEEVDSVVQVANLLVDSFLQLEEGI
jgi:hypothetical protein